MHKAATLALFAAILPAQNHFVAADHWFARFELRELPALTKAFEQSALGALLRTEAMVEAAAAMRHAQLAASTRQRQLEDYARSLSLLTADELLSRAMAALDPADFHDFTATGYYDTSSERPWPMTLACITADPRAEGRTTALYQQLCREFEKSVDSERQGEQKLGGFPADMFGPRQTHEDRSYLPEFYGRFGLLHLPGQFAYGFGDLAKLGSFGAKPPPAGGPGVELTVRFKSMPGGANEVQQLGIDLEGALKLSLCFVDQLLQSEAALDVTPGGLVDSLVNGKAKLPRQPLPTGGLLQLRLALAPDGCRRGLEPLLRELGIGADLGKQVQAFDGGLAIGVAAPAPGSLIPRLWLSLSLQDVKAFEALLQGLPQGEGGMKLEARQLAGRDCTLLRMPDMPAGLQPCFCIVDGTLHLAESPGSLTQLLRNLAGDGSAMAIGEAPLQPGDGATLPTFDLRYDFAAAYRTYHKVWLQPLRLLVKAEAGSNYFPVALLQPLVDPDLLPPPEVIEEHVRPGRAVLRRTGNRLVYQETGPIGGPVLTPIFGVYALLFASRMNMGSEWQLQSLQQRIDKHHLELLAAALQKYEKRSSKKAQSLAELASAGLLADDALLVPGDEAPDAIAYTDGEAHARILKSSIRYVPAGVKVKSYESESVLVAVRRQQPTSSADEGRQRMRSGNQVFLDADGTVREEYGDDDFLQAVQRAGATAAEQKARQQQQGGR